MTVIGGEVAERHLDGIGLLRYENCEAGEWLTQRGEPAKKPRRRYLLDGQDLVSVSSIVDNLHKPALIPWAEDHGARGGAALALAGQLDDCPPEEIIQRVRAAKLGSDAVRDEAADRGNAIHAGLEALVQTGKALDFADYPEAWRAWVQGAADAWLQLGCPRNGVAEEIVCNPARGYAGRPDLIVDVDGAWTLLDYKTGRGKIYDQAHYQTKLYDMANEACDLRPIDQILIVGISDQGKADLVACEATELDALSLIQIATGRKRINKGMATQRATRKKALAA